MTSVSEPSSDTQITPRVLDHRLPRTGACVDCTARADASVNDHRGRLHGGWRPDMPPSAHA